MTALARVAAPVVWLLEVSSRLVLRLLGRHEEPEQRVTEAEIRMLVAEGESAGSIEPEETRMITRVMQLGDRSVRALMTPRPEVDWVDLDQEPHDTTTPAGRMMMQMVGAFAEFERAMIRERTSAGIAAARAEGRVGGRRRKLDAAKRREIAESVITGRKSGAEMARLYNISQPTVSRIVAQHRIANL